MTNICPFKIGDYVIFTPSKRTLGLYQNFEKFGIHINEVIQIKEIRDKVYLYFDNNKGGWPWNEFSKYER